MELLNNLKEEKIDLSPYHEIVRQAGLDPELITDKKIFQRMAFLDKTSSSLKAGKNCIKYADLAAEYLGRHADQYGGPLTEGELRTVKAATLFTDIGKTGPADATPEQEMLVTSMFAVPVVLRATDITVENFLRQYFSDDADMRMEIFNSLKFQGQPLDSQKTTMRDFFNMHAHWSYDLMNGSGIPKEVMFAAASHHIAEGQNPGGILSEDGIFTKLDPPRKIDRREILIILLDKYDARRTRSGDTHARAIEWLEKYVENIKGKEISRYDYIRAELERGIEILRVALHPDQAGMAAEVQ